MAMENPPSKVIVASFLRPFSADAFTSLRVFNQSQLSPHLRCVEGLVRFSSDCYYYCRSLLNGRRWQLASLNVHER